MPNALAIVLHAHLPLLTGEPERDWLFEAMAETYVPLLEALEGLAETNQGPLLALSLSPTLCAMLADEATATGFVEYLDARIALADQTARAAPDSSTSEAARFHAEFYLHVRELFDRKCSRQLLSRFARLRDSGHVELLTTAATHAILPLASTDGAIHAQIAIACVEHERHFGHRPRGFWLPECAYRPGIEEFLAREGIDYFVVAAHAVLHATPKPASGPLLPVLCPNRLAAFPIDIESAKQVWCRNEGYPGHASYREFHRDIGFDAPYHEIKPFLHEDGLRRSLGVRCFRVTGDVPLGAKLPYEPQSAYAQAREHAGDFVQARSQQHHQAASDLGVDPLLLVAYDAELFGHWWFEGVHFLKEVLNLASAPASSITLTTPDQYLQNAGQLQQVQPATSSWGEGGYFDRWLSPANDWIYPELHEAEATMAHFAACFPMATEPVTRALRHMARELLLAQSSDWAFMISQGDTSDYGAQRTRLHLARFAELAEHLQADSVDTERLALLERDYTLFPNIDHRLWAPSSPPPPG